MIKQYFMFIPILKNYGSINKDSQTETGSLYMLFLSFNPMNDFIIVDRDENDLNIVIIRMQFPGDAEDEYGPEGILRMSLDNYKYIAQQWDKIIAQKPQYFVLSRDDSGWIDLELKSELSSEDQQCLEQDKIAKFK